MYLLLLGTLLPDIDTRFSTLGKIVPLEPVLKALDTNVKRKNSRFPYHRKFTHALLFTYGVYIINPFVAFGAASHIFLDMLNPTGCPLAHPLSKKKHKIGGYFKTGKATEKLMQVILLSAIGYVLYREYGSKIALPF